MSVRVRSPSGAQYSQKIFEIKKICVYLQSNSKEKEFGVWRSWLAHLVWDQRVLCSSHSTPTQKKSNHLILRWLLFFSPDPSPSQHLLHLTVDILRSKAELFIEDLVRRRVPERVETPYTSAGTDKTFESR